MFYTLWQRLTRQLKQSSGRKKRSSERPRNPFSFRPQLETLEDRVVPATFTVTNTFDTSASTLGSLRYAVLQADENPGSTISITAIGTDTLNPALGELVITAPTTITVTHDLGFTVNANGNSRCFEIGTAGTVSITGMVIENGVASTTDGNGNGGGIYDFYNTSVLDLNYDYISSNKASPTTGGGNGGGVFANGLVVAIDTVFEGNTAPDGYGGGIFDAADLNLSSLDVVADNSALAGGGVYQTGTGTTLDVNDSLVELNTATATGGGGIWAYYNVSVTDGSSVYENTAKTSSGNGGGIYSANGNVTVNDSSVNNNLAYGQGGGIWSFDTTTIKNGSEVNGNNAYAHGGGIFSLRGNVTIQGGTDGGSEVDGNTAGYSAGSTSGDGNIGNGGGIDEAGNSASTVSVDATSQVNGNTANGNGGGIYGLTVNIFGEVNDNTASTPTTNALLGNGGGIYGQAVTVNGGEVNGNNAALNGGGIYSDPGYVTLVDGAEVEYNSAGGLLGYGGGVCVFYGDVFMDDSSVCWNTAWFGGGIAVLDISYSDNVVIQDGSNVCHNRANYDGGGLYLFQLGSVTIDDSCIMCNTANFDGGGIYAYDVSNISIVDDSSITDNTAITGNGGGAYVWNGDLYVFGNGVGSEDNISGNTAVEGGGLYLVLVQTYIGYTEFNDDVATGGPHAGSDLFADSESSVIVFSTQFNGTVGFSDLIDTADQYFTGTPGFITTAGDNYVADGSWIYIFGFSPGDAYGDTV